MDGLFNRNGSTRRIGEVIATSTTEFEAQSVELHSAPPLGGLVRVRLDDDRLVYGLVCGACTDGVDAGVRPVPRARDGAEDAAVYLEHPDLAYVLRTCFQCLVVGHRDGEQFGQELPPRPVPIHYSVLECSDEEVRAFTSELDHLRIVLQARDVPTDEILVAHVRLAADARRPLSGSMESSYDFAVRVGREIARLLRDDNLRQRTILQRISRSAGPSPRQRLGGNGHEAALIPGLR